MFWSRFGDGDSDIFENVRPNLRVLMENGVVVMKNAVWMAVGRDFQRVFVSRLNSSQSCEPFVVKAHLPSHFCAWIEIFASL